MTFYYRYDKKTKTAKYSDGYFSDSSVKVNTTKVFDIETVIDPKTREEVSAQEAVHRGIIDEATGMHSSLLLMQGRDTNSRVSATLCRYIPLKPE